MNPGIKTGVRQTTDLTTDHVLYIEDGIKLLNPKHNGIKFIQDLMSNSEGDNGKVDSSTFRWRETALVTRKETVTIADGTTTAVTVVNSAAYPVGTDLVVENEHMQVTAHTNGTTLAVQRGYLGTTAVAHAAKTMYNLGYSGEEDGSGPDAISTGALEFYNYIQTFEQTQAMSWREIAEKSSEIGSIWDRQLERLTLSFWKLFAQAMFKGRRYLDSSSGKNRYYTGGIDYFLSTFVYNVGGAALTISMIDLTFILPMVLVGADPDTMVCSPMMSYKLATLDANLRRYLGKAEMAGGLPAMPSWKSPLLDRELDLIIDHTPANDELYIGDRSMLGLKTLVNNGYDGRFRVVEDAKGTRNGKRAVLRCDKGLIVHLEASWMKAYNIG